MKTCSICNIKFNDGVLCGFSKNLFDFGCAKISEAGWRKLGSDRRNQLSQWKCSACRITSPVITADPPASPIVTSDTSASLVTILSEIQDMKQQLSSLPTLIEDIRTIKNELAELKIACDTSNLKLEEFSTRLVELESKVSHLDKAQDTLTAVQVELTKTKQELSAQEHRSRLNNIEIKGVPLKKDENLFLLMDAIGRKIDYVCPKAQINYVSRVPMYNSNEKLIIVSFLNRYIKDDFMAAARGAKDLSTADLGFQGVSHRIYINDHLTANTKQLLTNVKIAAKVKHYEYVWVKHGKIHVRKNNDSKAFIIVKQGDLNKIV